MCFMELSSYQLFYIFCGLQCCKFLNLPNLLVPSLHVYCFFFILHVFLWLVQPMLETGRSSVGMCVELIQTQNGIVSGIRFLNQAVILFAFKKRRKNFLTSSSLKNFVPRHLIALNIFLPLELQGGSLQSENHISSLVILCSAMNLESLWNSLQIVMLVSEF